MAKLPDLDFQEFVADRKARQPGAAVGDAHAYAYVSDRATRATFQRVKPIELAVSAGVRVFKHVGKARLLGQAVKVGPKQFPRVHAITRDCAATLGIPTPTTYVVNSPFLNAATYGTNDDSFIMLNSALVDHFSDRELAAVIGHECGHIHNNHVVYLTVLYYLSNLAGAAVRSVGIPALLGLRAWARRAEITCDRAAALCVKDVDVVVRTIAKLALGSQKLYEQLNLEAFLEQYDEAQATVGRFSEVFATHPWLPKRVLALRHFAASEFYRRHAGEGSDGLSMEQVDEKVHGIVKVVG